MGLLTSQMSLAQAISARSNIDYQMSLIQSTLSSLTQQVTDMVTLGADLIPGSPEEKALQKKKERLLEVEKSLERKYQNYQHQLELIDKQEQLANQQRQSALSRIA